MSRPKGTLPPGRLPSEVSESLVGIGHAVRVLTLGDRSTFLAVSCHQFIGQLDGGCSSLLFANGTEDPTERKGLLSILVDLHGNLVRRTADSLRTNLDIRFHVLDRLFEDFDGWPILDLLSDFIQSIVEDVVGDSLLAIVHQAIDELRDEQRIVSGIGTKGRS